MATEKPKQAKPYPDLGDAVARRRLAADLTQREIADRIHYNAGYIPRIEGGRMRPRPEVPRLIAAATDSDPTDLLALAGYLKPNEAEMEHEADAVRRFRRLPEPIQKLLVTLGNAMVLQEVADDLELRGRRAPRRVETLSTFSRIGRVEGLALRRGEPRTRPAATCTFCLSRKCTFCETGSFAYICGFPAKCAACAQHVCYTHVGNILPRASNRVFALFSAR